MSTILISKPSPKITFTYINPIQIYLKNMFSILKDLPYNKQHPSSGVQPVKWDLQNFKLLATEDQRNINIGQSERSPNWKWTQAFRI